MTELRVLLAGGDSREQGRWAELLRAAGLRVWLADDGVRVLDLATREELDGVVLEWGLSGGGGLAVCHRLKADSRSRRTAVVLVATPQECDGEQIFTQGVSDCLIRPFAGPMLVARLRAHAVHSRLCRTLERKLSRCNADLEVAVGERRRLTVQLALAEARERYDLAARLHDSPLQKLALSQMYLEWLGREATEPLPHLLQARELLESAIGELRSLLFELSPGVLSAAGLAEALGQLAERTTRLGITRLSFRHRGDMADLPEALSVTLYRCALELVNNVLRHARAARADMELQVDDAWVTLTVSDDGIGSASTPPGFGLTRLQERVCCLGGEVVQEPAGPGTRVRVRLPHRDAAGSS